MDVFERAVAGDLPDSLESELGSKSASAIEDMVAYAQETQHKMILWGLAVGISLVMYGRLEEADPLIESLTRDKDAILRRSGMFTIAMAYCGTGNISAIRKLLHVAVSDVNDDVRRAAVMGLGKLNYYLYLFLFIALVQGSCCLSSLTTALVLCSR